MRPWGCLQLGATRHRCLRRHRPPGPWPSTDRLAGELLPIPAGAAQQQAGMVGIVLPPEPFAIAVAGDACVVGARQGKLLPLPAQHHRGSRQGAGEGVGDTHRIDRTCQQLSLQGFAAAEIGAGRRRRVAGGCAGWGNEQRKQEQKRKKKWEKGEGQHPSGPASQTPPHG